MGLKSKMVFLGLKMKSLAKWAWAHWAELLVALTLLGSGVLMKAAPYFHALSYVQAKLPIELGLAAFEKEIAASWDGFVKVPYLKKAFVLLHAKTNIEVSSGTFMIVIAALDLFFGVPLLLGKSKYKANAAGLWMLIQMLGAEYCVRMSGMYLSSAKKLPHYEIVMTATHVLIGCAALCCTESCNIGGWMWSCVFPKPASKTTPATTATATASATAATASARGRAAMSGGSAQKRTSTPGPKSSPKMSAKKKN